MNNKVTTFLMFNGEAEEAMNFYISLFKNSEIKSIIRYKKNEAGKEGSVMNAVFSLKGQEFICIDSPVNHDFIFTPAISLFVKCESEEEISSLFKKLSENGKVFMPMDSYGFSEKYSWLEDKHGVSWQLQFNKF